MGDGGSGNDPQNHAQDLTSLLGKMLRIDVNTTTGTLPYGIPPNNPFVGSAQPGARAEIWAYGLRNPWRFSFDRLTGALLIADVGQDAREEIDFVRAGSAGGMNFGWRVMEGTQCTNLPGDLPCNDPSFTPPIVDYDHGQGCSVTGGYLYRGRAVPELISTSSRGEKGVYVYGDLCSGTIWGISATATGGVSNSVLLASGLYITTFGEDENGEIYVADAAASKIYRLVSTESNFISKSDCLFNWAEKTYLNLFAPVGALSNTLTPYYYRYYPQTNAYLGMSPADNHVYYLGPLSNNSILDIGALSPWLSMAGCG
jgi:glucose/arabinose dehydrogenase